MISSQFAHLPNEIIREIISFIGTYKERNGKLMEQIKKDDPRYAILLTIPRVTHFCEQNIPNVSHTYVENNEIANSYTTFIYLKKSDYPGLNIFIRVSVITEAHNYFPPPKRSFITHRWVAYNNYEEAYRVYDSNEILKL